VLDLTAPGSSAQSVGLVVHRALERFLIARRDAEAEGVAPPVLDDLLKSARDLYLRNIGPQHTPDPHVDRQIQTQLRLVHENLLRDTDDILELERRVVFEFPHAGITHKFDAKIDRIDRLPDGGLRIIDYKTGQPSKSKTEPKPDDLQLGIYALAAAALYQTGDQPPPGVAEYWVLSSGERGVISLADLRLDKVRSKVGKAIDGILAADFPKGKSCAGECDLFYPDESSSASDD
jgi:RecB family exonuclease